MPLCRGDEATHLLEIGDGNLADAYYWRACNHRSLAQLAEARKDISAAKELITTPDVLSLAGIIEYEQGDLDPAAADLTAAIGAAGEDCTPRWYLALVHRQRKRWLASGHAFEDAMVCFHDRAGQHGETPCPASTRRSRSAYRANAVASFEASALCQPCLIGRTIDHDEVRRSRCSGFGDHDRAQPLGSPDASAGDGAQ